MRVLVTGASGFAGQWLIKELESAGHDVIAAPRSSALDFGSSPNLDPLLRATRPNAVAHLAGVAFVPAAAGAPDLARRINVGGAQALFAGLDAVNSRAAVLVASSAAVYGSPDELPIKEIAPIRPTTDYARTKADQERVAADAMGVGRRVVIARAFNHIGPGQSPNFVAPKLARDVRSLQAGRLQSIPVGNVDVRRDFTDVRDVVVAYRLLLEAAVAGRTDGNAYNIGSGHSIAIRDLLYRLCDLAGVRARWHVDPALVRSDDVADIYADTTRIRRLTGWRPVVPLEESLRDLLASTPS